MAARSDAATDRVARTTAPSLATASFCCWAKLGAVHAGNLFHPIMRIEASGGSAAIFGFKGTNGRTPSLYSGSSTTGIAGAEQALATYVFLGFTMNGGAAQLFYGTTPGSLTKVTGTVNTTGTPDTLTLFGRSPSDGSEWLEGTLDGVRLWTGVLLSDAEMAAESNLAVPDATTPAAKTSGLWGSWPLTAASLSDVSGNARHLTAGSTALSSDTGPTFGVTGSGALTAPAAVASGTGTVVVSGTGTATAPKAVAAGTGTVAVTGVGAATAPPAVAAGTGSVVVAASGALTAPRAVAAGTGAVAVSGTGALTAPAATASGTGGVVITGSGACVAPAAVVAGTGGGLAPIEGVGALVAPAARVNGTGQVVVTGVGACVAPAAVVHGYERAIRAAADPTVTIGRNLSTLAVARNPPTLAAAANQATLTITEEA